MNALSIPASHRCLAISEIFQFIVEWLCLSPSGKRTLVSLVRTCKTLHKASAAALWRDQRSLVPLLRLLPSCAWEEVPLEGGGHIFRIIRPRRLEWTRIKYYAQYVRRFVWNKRQDVCLESLLALCARLPAGQPLLPQLRTLHFQDSRVTHLRILHLFLSPTITHLALQFNNIVPSVLASPFKRIREACKRVTSLELRMHRLSGYMLQKFSGNVGDAYGQLLYSLKELTSYRGNVFLPAICVEALAVLPRLSAMEVYVNEYEMATITGCDIRKDAWFNTLKMLDLGLVRMDGSTKTFLGALPEGNLRQVQLSTQKQPNTDTIKQHLALVARAAHRDSFTHLQLDLGRTQVRPSETAIPPVIDVGVALRPLYAFPHIDYVCIQCPALAVSANSIRDIAHAWPQLATLSLNSYNPYPPGSNTPCLTLTNLVPLAQNCAHLDTLGLHLHAHKLPDAETLARLLPAPSQCGLRRLTAFAGVNIENPAEVAGVLARLFPVLREAEYGKIAWVPEGDQQPFEGRWEMVQRLLGWRLDVTNGP
ncbi:uncharacterized protein TRAVEDRAFT_22239 [Trametes versicolor FP-101664 SS1]|uniref:uncharacterized protein n=1 Tax=Trametes versicolor (strain FP-101664) TaxID=717944 RepID=UPI0004622800|nr:uncharacterized protein TRAVEDRAFT_22239 [Trametes versicolor FP-101664 SS1]EIW55800.1 hypothetical protein TRAVEDRAFT_22239 [Trametes versicolor FP-101664 SS1]